MFFEKLQNRKNDGFTLVELIVVIAILAILAGIAVPAYSGYVEKANIAADQTLVSEVASGLLLYYYDNYETAPSGYVTLTSEGASADAAGTAAMQAVFGDEWAETATLKHNGWSNNLAMIDIALGQDFSHLVPDSSFLTGSTTDKLLQQVSDLTNTALSFMTNYTKDDPKELYSLIKDNFTSESVDETAFQTMLNTYGLDVTGTGADTAFDMGTDKDAFKQKLANMLVLAAAKDMTTSMSNPKEDGTSPELSSASGLVLQYAGFTGAINSGLATEADKAAYDQLNATLATSKNPTEVLSAFNTFQSAAGTLMNNYMGEDGSNETYVNDILAFGSIMGAVDSVSGDISEADMAKKDLYTSSYVADKFNSYTAATELAGKVDSTVLSSIGDVPAGSVILILGNGQVVCSDPNAYLQ